MSEAAKIGKHEEKTSDFFLLDLLQDTQTQRVWSRFKYLMQCICLCGWLQKVMLPEMTVTPERQKSIHFCSKLERHLNIKDQSINFVPWKNRYQPEFNNILRS